MKPWANWTAKTILLTTGFAAAGGGLPGVAFAAAGPHTGNVSVLSGNRVNAPASIPVNICGNAAAILGVATAGCEGGAMVVGSITHRPAYSRERGPSTSRERGPSTANVSVGHGNVVKLPLEIATNACGNAVGNGTAHCRGTVTLPMAGWPAGGTRWPMGGIEPRRATMSAGNLSVGSGNDVQAPVSAPVTVCGNAAAALGDSSAGCLGGVTVGYQADRARKFGKFTSKASNKFSSKDSNKVWSRISHPSKAQLAGLGALPGVATIPGLGDVASLSPLNDLTGGRALMPANTLSAYQEKALPGTFGSAGGGMSSDSLATLAIGALLAGAAALKLANRRRRVHRVRAGQVRP
jgi:hypothetical protein